MTVSYDNNNEAMTIACDTEGCLHDEQAEGSFRGCLNEFKQQGWKTFMVDGEWNHSCPTCFALWKQNNGAEARFKKQVAEEQRMLANGEIVAPPMSEELPF